MSVKVLTIALAGVLVAGSGGAAMADWTQPNPQARRMCEALNLLESRGDGQFSHFRPSGNEFTAEVTKEGRLEQVMIDPGSRRIQVLSTSG